MATRALLEMFYRSPFGRALKASLLRDLRGEMTAEVESVAAATVARMLRDSASRQAPSAALRDFEHVRLDAKVLGSALARQLHEAAGLDDTRHGTAPERVGLSSKLCVQADIESHWLRHWCGQLRMRPVYHRKVWEDCFLMQALWEAGMLAPGRRALGFAVGREKIPSLLVREGIEVVATDLAAADQRSAGWQATNQHTAGLRELHDPSLCDWEAFERLCRFAPVDMNAIPPEFDNRFDFCWSVCSFEHLGSIEHGLAFVENALRCLKPGGVAVHTTEYNLSTGPETIDFHGTVLFQRPHIEALEQRLAAQGHRLLPVDYSTGAGLLDSFVDVPPYPHDARGWDLPLPDAPHLRLSTDGFAVTSIGLIVARAA